MAAKKKAPAGVNMKLFYGVLALIAVVGIGGILYARTRGGMATEPLDMTQVPDANVLLEQAQGITIGPENAPVQVLVFSDFMCPGCGHWVGQVEPLLKADLIESGKVRYTYYDFPLTPGHRHSFIAARAARCAGDQGKFWEYHDRLFAQQQQWSYEVETPTGKLLQYGKDIGLDERAFNSCVRSDKHADVVTANKMLGETLGVGGTPTVYVNGRRLGEKEWQQYEVVKSIIQGAGGV